MAARKRVRKLLYRHLQRFEESEKRLGIDQRVRRTGPGTVMTVVFRIAGQRFIALNGGAEFPVQRIGIFVLW